MGANRKLNAISRRELLAGAGAAGMLAMMPQLSAAEPVGFMGVNALLAGPLRDILQQSVGREIKDGPFVSTTDNVTRLATPGGANLFDVMIGTTSLSKAGALGPKSGMERVRAFDLSKVPNAAQLETFLKKDVVTRDGQTFMIPVFLGFDTVIYNRKEVQDDDIQSWGAIFEDKYAGRIAWMDTAQQMIFAAGLYLGHAEPEKIKGKDLDEVTNFLIKKKKNVRTFWTTFAQEVGLFASGEVVVAYAPIPVRTELRQKGLDIGSAWVKEGVLSFSQSAYIPKSAKNPEGGEALVNAMLGKDYASEITKVNGYLATTTAGSEGLSEAERTTLGYAIFDGKIKSHELSFPDDISNWITAFNRVKSA
ncbi:extracellular solute-binding protein [Bradyrhizobium sp. NP1]|uniref:ABC transporter substrate-binding protein n=1 Tax=Bradyrhizobium sp. NP1 TaxID=3049772 RepID=UPI0025A5F764|nr:extracellular solute-binding protein [Bradyrhizobium sp. NP1]WJR77270.1 extracellular solute-binding protein [Bradyrhizobium sp. NP1]